MVSSHIFGSFLVLCSHEHLSPCTSATKKKKWLNHEICEIYIYIYIYRERERERKRVRVRSSQSTLPSPPLMASDTFQPDPVTIAGDLVQGA